MKGYSGSGKSVLVNTLREVVSTEGYFVLGEFDKIGSVVPYRAIVEAAFSNHFLPGKKPNRFDETFRM